MGFVGPWRLDVMAPRRVLLPLGGWLCTAALFGAAGCGGGSSGFDIAAEQAAEQALVEEVVAALDCSSLGGTVICGSGGAEDSATPVPLEGDFQVSISPASGRPLGCVGDATTGCTATIVFSGSVEPGSTLRAVAGPVDPPAGWVAGETALSESGGDTRVELQVILPAAGPVELESGALVRVAVLVYLPGQRVPSAPAGVTDLLSQFGADIAVVATDLSLTLSVPAAGQTS